MLVVTMMSVVMVAVRMTVVETVMVTIGRQFQAVAAKYATPSAVTKLQSQIYNCSDLQLKIPNSRSREVYLSFFFVFFLRRSRSFMLTGILALEFFLIFCISVLVGPSVCIYLSPGLLLPIGLDLILCRTDDLGIYTSFQSSRST